MGTQGVPGMLGQPGDKVSVMFLTILTRHFTLRVPLSTQEYKWVRAKCQQGNLTKMLEV